MRIFDFLLSGANNTDTSVEVSWQSSNTVITSSVLGDIARISDSSTAFNARENDILHPVDFESTESAL